MVEGSKIKTSHPRGTKHGSQEDHKIKHCNQEEHKDIGSQEDKK